jgi:hypothetical protein
MDKVGHPHIDAFGAAMEREGDQGLAARLSSRKSAAASLSPSTSPATPNKCARHFIGGRGAIKLLTVPEIPGEEHVRLGRRRYAVERHHATPTAIVAIARRRSSGNRSAYPASQ